MNGILNIYKEQNFTSNDVVAKLRGICHMKKIGHTGTLDPMATGVLPVCLGSATKLCDMLTDHDKVYKATLLLGMVSDTQDIWGKVTQCSYAAGAKDSASLTEDKIREAIAGFVGEYDQIPPMYSAKKINGQKLYDLARSGITVERKPSRVRIYSIDINEIKLPRITMTVCCGKGTYIRTLCNDIGERLGCGGLMEDLTRLRVGQFKADDAITLARAQEYMDAGTLEEHIIPVDEFFNDCPALRLDEKFDKPVHNGNPLPKEIAWDGAGKSPCAGIKFRIYDSAGSFAGVYEYNEQQRMLMPYKMFLT